RCGVRTLTGRAHVVGPRVSDRYRAVDGPIERQRLDKLQTLIDLLVYIEPQGVALHPRVNHDTVLVEIITRNEVPRIFRAAGYRDLMVGHPRLAENEILPIGPLPYRLRVIERFRQVARFRPIIQENRV